MGSTIGTPGGLGHYISEDEGDDKDGIMMSCHSGQSSIRATSNYGHEMAAVRPRHLRRAACPRRDGVPLHLQLVPQQV